MEKSMLRIIKSNLTERQSNFLRDELYRAQHHMENSGASVSKLNISLISDERTCDTAGSYKDYLESQRNMQSFEIKRNGTDVLINGGAYPGILNGLYTLLKNQLGIRWYGVNEEDICCIKNPVPFPEKEKPAVPLRGFEGSLKSWSIDFTRQFMLWMARNGWNQLLFNAGYWRSSQAQEIITETADLCGINLVIGGHSFELFLPDEMFAEKPELFGMRNGIRCVKGETGIAEKPGHSFTSRIQPCLSNPECRALITRNALEFLERFKEIKVFSLWPHDGINNWCQCPSCLQHSPYELMHQLARQIISTCRRKIYIELLAYSNLLKTPRNLPYEPSIYTLFCPYLRNYHRRLFEPGFPASKARLGSRYPEIEPVYPVDDREYGHLFKKWLPEIAKSGGTLGIFAYYQLVFHDIRGGWDRSRYLRYPEPGLIRDELRYFIKHGMQVYYDCSWPHPGFWPDGRLYSFYSRLLWDRNCKIEPFIDEHNSIDKDMSQFLDKVSHILDSDIRDFSILAPLITSLPDMHSGRWQRVKIWLAYLKLAMVSFTAAAKNADSEVVDAEKKIIKLFKEHRKTLEMYVSVNWMIRYSESVIRHCSENKLLNKKMSNVN
jgi:hypothetical protein